MHNSGAGVMHEMIMKIDSLIRRSKGEDSILYHKLRFHLVHITNSSKDKKELKPLHPLANNLASPLLTVLGTYGAQTSINDDRLMQYFRNFSDGSHIVDDDINLYRDITPVRLSDGSQIITFRESEYSFNWVISKYNLDRMDTRVAEMMDTFKSKHLYGLR